MGKYLGNKLTEEQSNAIRRYTETGVLPDEEIQIGDYWVINGLTWRVDSFLGPYGIRTVGPVTHHCVICPCSKEGGGDNT